MVGTRYGRRNVAASGMKRANTSSCSGTTTRAGTPSSFLIPKPAQRRLAGPIEAKQIDVGHGQRLPECETDRWIETLQYQREQIPVGGEHDLLCAMLSLQPPHHGQSALLRGGIRLASLVRQVWVTPGCFYCLGEIGGRAVTQSPLAEIRLDVHRQMKPTRQGCDRLDGAAIRTRIDRADRILRQDVCYTVGVSASSGRKRAILVRRPVGMCVSHQVEGCHRSNRLNGQKSP